MTAQRKHVEAEHGSVCSMSQDFFGYFGWPSVALMDDGTLVVAASGLRNDHMCPFGRTVILSSTDQGQSWSMPRVINDTPLDDRDAGITNLGGRRLLVTWFTTDRRPDYAGHMAARMVSMEPLRRQRWLATTAVITQQDVDQYRGSWVRVSDDQGASWGRPVRVPVTAPHGCLRMRNGNLLYLGKIFATQEELHHGCIAAAISEDEGGTWRLLGSVPLAPGITNSNCHEPHVVELPSGRLLGSIRGQNSGQCNMAEAGYVPFSIFVTDSTDGGITWTPMRPLGFHGSPPHLVYHSSGAVVLTYGYRLQPFGQRVAISLDEGQTWDHDWVLRNDGADADLGYPATVELPDNSLFTVYYQKPKSTNDQCALLWSRWRLPR